MPKPARPSNRLRSAVMAAAATLALAGIWFAWGAVLGARAAQTGVAARVKGPAPGSDRGDVAAVAPAPASSPTGPALRGSLSAAQWRTIAARIEPGPDHGRELARIANLLGFQAAVARTRPFRRGVAGRVHCAGERVPFH